MESCWWRQRLVVRTFTSYIMDTKRVWLATRQCLLLHYYLFSINAYEPAKTDAWPSAYWMRCYIPIIYIYIFKTCSSLTCMSSWEQIEMRKSWSRSVAAKSCPADHRVLYCVSTGSNREVLALSCDIESWPSPSSSIPLMLIYFHRLCYRFTLLLCLFQFLLYTQSLYLLIPATIHTPILL